MTFSRSADPLPVAGLVLLAAVGGTVLIRRSSPRPAVVLACVTLLLAVPQEVPFGDRPHSPGAQLTTSWEGG